MSGTTWPLLQFGLRHVMVWAALASVACALAAAWMGYLRQIETANSGCLPLETAHLTVVLLLLFLTVMVSISGAIPMCLIAALWQLRRGRKF